MAGDLRDLKKLLEPTPPWWTDPRQMSEDWMLWNYGQ